MADPTKEVKTIDIPFSVGLDQSDDDQGNPQGFQVISDIRWDKSTVCQPRGGFVYQKALAGTARSFVRSGEELGVVTNTADVISVSRPAAASVTYPNRVSVDQIGKYSLGLGQRANTLRTDVAVIERGGRRLAGVATVVAGAIDTNGNVSGGSCMFGIVDIDTGSLLYVGGKGATCSAARVIARDNGSGTLVFILLTVEDTGALFVRKFTFNETTLAFAEVDIYAPGNVVYSPDGNGGASVAIIPNASDATKFFIAYNKDNGATNAPTVSHLNTSGTVSSTTTVVSLALKSCTAFSLAHITTGGADVVWVAFGNVTDGGFLIYQLAGASYATVTNKVSNHVGDFVTYTSLLAWSGNISYAYTYRDDLFTSPDVAFTEVHHLVYPALTSLMATSSLPYRVGVTDLVYYNNGVFLAAVQYPPTAAGSVNSAVLYDVTGTLPSPAVAQPVFDQFLHIVTSATLFVFPPSSSSPSKLVLTTNNDIIGVLPVVQEAPGTTLAVGGTAPVVVAGLFNLQSTGKDLSAIPTATIGTVGFVAGSNPATWDGFNLGPAGFVMPPQLVGNDAAAVTVTPGTYTACCVIEYVDARGNLMVSAPSSNTTFTIGSSPGGRFLSYGIPSWAPFSLGSQAVRAKLYLTGEASGASATVFHLFDMATVGDASGHWVFTVAPADTFYLSNEQLYTTGGVVEAGPVPPLSTVWSFRNRLFGVREDQPETVAYTQEITDPFFPQWNQVLTLRVDNNSGHPTAGAQLQDKCLIFQPNQVVAVNGFGPDSAGTGSFSLPEVVVFGKGTDFANRNSVVVIPQGVMFRHSSGIFLVDPSLQVSDVGQQVSDILDGKVVRMARYLPSIHQVWLFLSDAAGVSYQQVLVFDTRYTRWSVWSPPANLIDAAELNGTVYAISSTGLFTYSLTSLQDNDGVTTGNISLVGKTPWIRKDRGQVNRVRMVTVTGTKLTAAATEHNSLSVSVYTQSDRRYEKAAGTADNTFTWAAAYLDTLPVGPFTLTARMVTPRCQAFSAQVTYSGDTASFRIATVSIDYVETDTRNKPPTGARPSAS